MRHAGQASVVPGKGEPRSVVVEGDLEHLESQGGRRARLPQEQLGLLPLILLDPDLAGVQHLGPGSAPGAARGSRPAGRAPRPDRPRPPRWRRGSSSRPRAGRAPLGQRDLGSLEDAIEIVARRHVRPRRHRAPSARIKATAPRVARVGPAERGARSGSGGDAPLWRGRAAGGPTAADLLTFTPRLRGA